MRIYVQSLTDAEKLELGRLLLKAGYCVRLGKERQGKAWRRYLEAEPCTKETAPGGSDTGGGGKENH